MRQAIKITPLEISAINLMNGDEVQKPQFEKLLEERLAKKGNFIDTIAYLVSISKGNEPNFKEVIKDLLNQSNHDDKSIILKEIMNCHSGGADRIMRDLKDFSFPMSDILTQNYTRNTPSTEVSKAIVSRLISQSQSIAVA